MAGKSTKDTELQETWKTATNVPRIQHSAAALAALAAQWTTMPPEPTVEAVEIVASVKAAEMGVDWKKQDETSRKDIRDAVSADIQAARAR